MDRSADDPALDYPLATKADLEEVADRHGAAVRAVVGDVRSAVGHAGRGGRGRHALRRPAGGRRRGRRDQRRPAAVGDPRRPVGRAVRRQRQRRAPPGRRRRAGAAGRRRRRARDAWWPWPRRPGCSGCRASAPTARPSTRSSGSSAPWRPTWPARGITANAVCPGSTRGPMLDASAAVYGLPSTEEFASHQLVRAPARAGGAGRVDRLVVRPGLVGRDRGGPPGRRRHDHFVGTGRQEEVMAHGRVHPSGPDRRRRAADARRVRRVHEDRRHAGCTCACACPAGRSTAATPRPTSTPRSTSTRRATRSISPSSPARTGSGATSTRSPWSPARTRLCP